MDEINIAKTGYEKARLDFFEFERKIFSSVYKNDRLEEEFMVAPSPDEDQKVYCVGYAIGCYSMLIGFKGFLKQNKLRSSLETLMKSAIVDDLCKFKQDIIYFVKENGVDHFPDFARSFPDIAFGSYSCLELI